MIKYIKLTYIFYKMELNLHPNRRYLFQTKDKKFRATVIDVLFNQKTNYKTLRLKKFIYENGDILDADCMVTMPYSWIEKAETLEDILGNKNNDITLPSDILLEIDSFH